MNDNYNAKTRLLLRAIGELLSSLATHNAVRVAQTGQHNHTVNATGDRILTEAIQLVRTAERQLRRSYLNGRGLPRTLSAYYVTATPRPNTKGHYAHLGVIASEDDAVFLIEKHAKQNDLPPANARQWYDYNILPTEVIL